MTGVPLYTALASGRIASVRLLRHAPVGSPGAPDRGLSMAEEGTTPEAMPNDPRMRGFRSRTGVDEAIALIVGRVRALGAESIDFTQAAGRVLAREVVASEPVPPFDRAAMDGYAVRGEETFGASTYNPAPFRLVGIARPGRACDVEVGPGEAVQIATGSALPRGADTVVKVESTQRGGRCRLGLRADPARPARRAPRRGHRGRHGRPRGGTRPPPAGPRGPQLRGRRVDRGRPTPGRRGDRHRRRAAPRRDAGPRLPDRRRELRHARGADRPRRRDRAGGRPPARRSRPHPPRRSPTPRRRPTPS